MDDVCCVAGSEVRQKISVHVRQGKGSATTPSSSGCHSDDTDCRF